MASKKPDGDIWNIVDNDEMSQHYGRNFKFDFSYISSDEIKELFKDYVWQNHRVHNKTLNSLYYEVASKIPMVITTTLQAISSDVLLEQICFLRVQTSM